MREQWGELRKFMAKVGPAASLEARIGEFWGLLTSYHLWQVKGRYPASQCFLKTGKLYVDHRWALAHDPRMFVWNSEQGRVQEQTVITLPHTTSTPPQVHHLYL